MSNEFIDNLVITGGGFDAQLAGAYLLKKLKGNTVHTNFEYQQNNKLDEVYPKVGNRPINIYLVGLENVWNKNIEYFHGFITNVKNRTNDIKIYYYSRFGKFDDSSIAEYVVQALGNPDTMIFSTVAISFGDTHGYELGQAYLKWDTSVEEFSSLVKVYTLYSQFYRASLADNFINFMNVSNTEYNGNTPIFDLSDNGLSNLLDVRMENVTNLRLKKIINKLSKYTYSLRVNNKNHSITYINVDTSDTISEIASQVWKVNGYQNNVLIFTEFVDYGVNISIRTPEDSALSAIDIANKINKNSALGNDRAAVTTGFYKALDTLAHQLLEVL